MYFPHKRYNNSEVQSNQSCNNTSMVFPYLHQGAVAIPRRLCVKVVMMIDGCEAGDHRLQGSAMLLNLFHTCDQALGNTAVRQIRRATQSRNIVFTNRLQGCKHNLEIHVRVWETKRDERSY